MKKTTKENITKKIEMLKASMGLSDEMFEKVYGVKKEEGVINVLNVILEDLNND